MEIRELHQASITDGEAEQLAALWDLVDPERLRTDPPVTPQLAINDLRPSHGTFEFCYYGLFDDGRLVGHGETYGTVGAENTDVCELGIWVHPDHLGRGLHRDLFDHIEAIERAKGRTRFWGWGDLNDEPTRGFWEDELGFTLAYDERLSRCVLDQVDAELMTQWVDRAAERAGGYELIRAEAPFDDEQLALFAAGLEAMNDAPLEDLEMEHEHFDVDRARQVETLHLSTRSTYRAVFCIETSTRELAGFTAVRLPDADPTHAKQGDTVTVDAHRNRGIGRWLKADMWHWLRNDRPGVRFIDTGNAESNRAMLDINEAMGFRDIIHHGVWQLA